MLKLKALRNAFNPSKAIARLYYKIPLFIRMVESSAKTAIYLEIVQNCQEFVHQSIEKFLLKHPWSEWKKIWMVKLSNDKLEL